MGIRKKMINHFFEKELKMRKQNKDLLKFGSLGVVFFLLLTLALAQNVKANTTVMTKQVNEYKVELSFMSPTIKTGANEIMVRIKDAQDKPIENVKITLTADMDRGASMAGHGMEMQKPIKLELQPAHEMEKMGDYMARIEFSDKGQWLITVAFDAGAKNNQADFEVQVASAGPNWFLIGGFLALIVLVILIAGIAKRKRNKNVSKEN
jgi:uncharacterized integral membrane protein